MKRVLISLAAVSVAVLATQANAAPASYSCTCSLYYGNNESGPLDRAENLGSYEYVTAEECMTKQCKPRYTGSATGMNLKCELKHLCTNNLNPKTIWFLGTGAGFPKNPRYLKIWSTVTNQITMGVKKAEINGIVARKNRTVSW